MLKPFLDKLLARENLSAAESAQALESILGGADQRQTAAFLALLRAKGETPEELAGMVQSMREHMVCVDYSDPLIDTCGTGGDGAGTVNISTGAAILAAACGAKVAKHGNRSVSSKCGSADVLEALGIAVDLGAEQVVACIDEVGIGFMFAPKFHPAMLALAEIRRSLGIRTILNLVGPLVNPARTGYQLLGVGDPVYLDFMAEVLVQLGVQRALVVHGCGLDELSPLGIAEGREVHDGKIRRVQCDPHDFEIARCSLEDLRGGDSQQNAQLLRQALNTADGPISDALALNAGYALAISGVVDSAQEGVALAREKLAAGAAIETLENWIAVSRRLQECVA